MTDVGQSESGEKKKWDEQRYEINMSRLGVHVDLILQKVSRLLIPQGINHSRRVQAYILYICMHCGGECVTLEHDKSGKERSSNIDEGPVMASFKSLT